MSLTIGGEPTLAEEMALHRGGLLRPLWAATGGFVPIHPSLLEHAASVPWCAKCRTRMTEGTDIGPPMAVRLVCDSCGAKIEVARL